MEFRKIYDTIPEKFDKWRPNIVMKLLSVQSRKPILKTGCQYLGIELGENLASLASKKFGNYSNFSIVNGDFEKYELPENHYDLVYLAATIQWIPEEIAFPKVYKLLKKGGYLAMMFMVGDFQTPNKKLFDKIQEVYAENFHPETPYTQKLAYENVKKYGFTNFQKHTFISGREFDANDFVEYIGTHCDHIILKEPQKTKFYEGIRNVIKDNGNKVIFQDNIVLYLARKE